MPLSLERVRIGFDAAVALMRLIDRAKQVLRHKYPEGRLEDVLRDALETLLERKDPEKRLAPTEAELVAELAPEPRFLAAWRGGRYIPARDQARGLAARRRPLHLALRRRGQLCGSRDALEFDHFRPFAKGGAPTTRATSPAVPHAQPPRGARRRGNAQRRPRDFLRYVGFRQASRGFG